MAFKVFYPRKVDSIYPREVDRQTWAAFEGQLDPQIEFVSGEQLPAPADFQVLVAGNPTPEQLSVSPNLHTLIIPWAGVSDKVKELLADRPEIAVYNLHHNAITTAETALMLMFAAAKLIVPIDRAMRRHDWRPRYGPNYSAYLHGKTILVLGFGSIGRYVARVCRGMSMQVIGVRRSPEADLPDGLEAEVHPPEALPELLPRADVLMVTMPLTDETRGMIGVAELALLPEHAVLVNVGRGPVVDQEALYRALKDGRLHSAGIDVWYNYPPDEDSRENTPPSDFPFHELDNVVMSPHRGGGSREVETIRMRHLAELLNRLVHDGDAPNRVDLKRGY
jgi:phosphoglycerate dehydrogenase-like enzyme